MNIFRKLLNSILLFLAIAFLNQIRYIIAPYPRAGRQGGFIPSEKN
jgi:hypothetical protein